MAKVFQKIPHKERLRHIKYRDEQWARDEQRHEEELIRKMIAEKETACRSQEQPYRDDKHQEEMEMLRRLGIIT